MNDRQNKKNVHAGHRMRVKANVCKNGFSQLEDHKLLELLLFYAIPQADTNGLAHNLLNEFGSLKGVFTADINALCGVSGIGESTAVMLASMGEAFSRLQKTTADKRALYKSHADYCRLAQGYLSSETKENVYVFCFDASGRLKKAVNISQGTENTAYIDARKVVQSAMGCDAVAVVIAHNHPNGSGEPSASDLDSTRSLSVTLRKLGVMLADHIIVDENNNATSMYNDPEIKRIFY